MAVGLDISMTAGKSAMLTNEREMAIISNNMARANESGYHRQTADVDSNIVLEGRAGYFGTGSHLERIIRQYDKALESNLRSGISQNGYDQMYSRKLRQVEDTFGGSGSNALNDSVQNFAGALQQLATTPESIVDRQNVIGTANLVANQFNDHYENLKKLRDNMADNTTGVGAINDKITELNALADQIPALNDRIKELEEFAFNKQNANDLRDDRDKLVADMAKIAAVTVVEGSDSRYTISLGGHVIVDGTAGPPTTTDNINLTMAAGVPTLTWASDSSAVALSTGELDALVDARAYVTTKMTELNTYATQFASIINTQHALGRDLTDTAGGNLFDATTPGAMSVLITSPSKIAASANPFESGNGDNAAAMWSAMTSNVAALNNNSLMNNATRMQGEVAEDVHVADFSADSSLNIETMFRDAVYERSGVNMNEEMSNMLNVQRAFQATAKLINVVDDMLGTVISIA